MVATRVLPSRPWLVVVDPGVGEEEGPALFPIPGDMLPHQGEKDAIAAGFVGQREDDFEVRAFARARGRVGALPRAVDDQRAGFGIEDLVAEGIAVCAQPGVGWTG